MPDEPNLTQSTQTKLESESVADATLKAPPEPWYKTGAGFEADETHAKVLAKYPSQADANKALVAAQPLIHSKLALPKEDATPEERSKAVREILGKLGAPEKAEDYKLDSLIPQGIRDNPHYGEYRQQLGDVLVKHGALPAVVNDIFAVENKYAAIFGEDYEKGRAETINGLKGKVGEKNWDQYKKDAAAAGQKFGSEAVAKLVTDEENAAVMAICHELWDAKIREGSYKGSDSDAPRLPQAGSAPVPFSDEWYKKPQVEGVGT